MQDFEYSFGWAEKVVSQYFDSHPRATKIICEITSLDRKLVTLLLMKDASSWNKFKACVKQAIAWCKAPGADAFYRAQRERFKGDIARSLWRRGLLNRCGVLTDPGKVWYTLRAQKPGGRGDALGADAPYL